MLPDLQNNIVNITH